MIYFRTEMDILCILRNISKKLLLFVSSFVTVVWTQHTDSCLFVCLFSRHVKLSREIHCKSQHAK